MTRVEFDKKLAKIDFTKGANVEVLENYLLACLAQLEKFKFEEPSHELFLLIFSEARNGPKAVYDSSWKEIYTPHKELIDKTEWEEVNYEICSLVTDLIQTREIRSQPDYVQKKMTFEWNTEGGIRFYNGTTPSDILGYAATRLEGEYRETAFQERKVTWKEFMWPIWIGISYE